MIPTKIKYTIILDISTANRETNEEDIASAIDRILILGFQKIIKDNYPKQNMPIIIESEALILEHKIK